MKKNSLTINQKRSRWLHNYLINANFVNTLASMIFVGGVLKYNSYLSTNGAEPFLDPIIATSIASIFALTGFMLSAREAHNTTLFQISMIRDAYAVQRYSSPAEATSAIITSIAGAKIVKNTFFPNANERISGSIKNPDAHLVYNEWLKGSAGDEWLDIVSPEEIFDDRFRLIGEKTRVSGRKQHTVHVLKHQNTCPNFVLLEYPSGDKEVFWGWVSSKHADPNSEVPFVFRSSESELVAYYHELFDVLWDKKCWGNEIVNEYKAGSKKPSPASNQVVDKVGRWATISVFQQRWLTFGIYDIYVETNQKGQRGFEMSGVTCDQKLRVYAKDHHYRNEIAHYENRMFIEFGRKEGLEKRGVCFYIFSGDGGKWINGFYSDDGTEQRHSIFGIKVDDDQKLDSYDIGDTLEEQMKPIVLKVLNEAKRTGFIDRQGIENFDLETLELQSASDDRPTPHTP